MRILKLHKSNLVILLYIVGLLLYGVVFFLSITQLTEARKNTQAIRETTASTNKLVSGQSEILSAIKKVALDTQLTAEQQTTIIICMLHVPQSQRTTDVQKQCRNETLTTTPSSTPGNSSGTATNSVGNIPSSSSSQSTTQVTPTQPNNSQTQSSYTECIAAEPGLLNTILGAVECL